jgi:hypothetical protein
MCAGRVLVEELFWRQQFADTGGSAVMGSQGLENFTIKSGEWPSTLACGLHIHSTCITALPAFC